MAELQANFIAGTDTLLIICRNDQGDEWKPLMSLHFFEAVMLVGLLQRKIDAWSEMKLPVKTIIHKTGREI